MLQKSTRAWRLVVGILVSVSLYGCSLLLDFDRSQIPDVGVDASPDRSFVDGPPVTADAPFDVGPDGLDATLDATTDATDGGGDAADGSDATEGGSDASDAAGDASDGGDGGLAIINGCTEPDYGANDRRDGGTVQIDFGGGLGNAYNPRCVRVSVGQTVTFVGDFTMHPLQQFPADLANPMRPPGVPINTGTLAMYNFGNAGTFGYECAVHGAQQPFPTGMNGAIDVRP